MTISRENGAPHVFLKSKEPNPRPMIPALPVRCFLSNNADLSDFVVGGNVKVRGTVIGRVDVVIDAKDCVANPVMKLCRKLEDALGGVCDVDDTGDADVITISTEKRIESGGVERFIASTHGRIRCETASERYSAEDEYWYKIRKATDRELGYVGDTIVRSDRALCWGRFGRYEMSYPFSNDPVAENMRAKIQGVFDKL